MSKYVLQRWSGVAWYDTMCSPYETMGEIKAHLKDYGWHYTESNPYRIKDYNPKQKIKNYFPKYNLNSDKGVVVQNTFNF
jgi:hypothetical protein